MKAQSGFNGISGESHRGLDETPLEPQSIGNEFPMGARSNPNVISLGSHLDLNRNTDNKYSERSQRTPLGTQWKGDDISVRFQWYVNWLQIGSQWNFNDTLIGAQWDVNEFDVGSMKHQCVSMRFQWNRVSMDLQWSCMDPPARYHNHHRRDHALKTPSS